MNNIIVIEETNYSTYAAQGTSASGRKGFDIWYRERSGEMHWLGFITPDALDETIEYYRNIDPGVVEIRHLPSK